MPPPGRRDSRSDVVSSRRSLLVRSRRRLPGFGGNWWPTEARPGRTDDGRDWVRRRLVTERFRREFGVPPKTYARIIRFRRTLGMLNRVGRERTLADVATECGYYDQSHFNRDFTALAGCTPSAYLAELAGQRDVRFCQDDEPAGS